MTNAMKNVAGTFRHGTCCEKSMKLGTFIKSGVESINYIVGDAHVSVSIRRSMWETWSGAITQTTFAELRKLFFCDFTDLAARR
jgi:hypothetical protein